MARQGGHVSLRIQDNTVMIEQEILHALNSYRGQLHPNEIQSFNDLLGQYTSIWSPDSDVEICTTNRFSVIAQEATVVAVSKIIAREPIKCLTGFLAILSPEEEARLQVRGQDFSVIIPSRKKSPFNLLGPARFVNHDCNPNAEIIPKGIGKVEFRAKRLIAPGDEITFKYGDTFFGVNNTDCLCESCERKPCGGWTSSNNSPTAAGPAPQSRRITRGDSRKTARPLLWVEGPTKPKEFSVRIPGDYLDPNTCLPWLMTDVTLCKTCALYRYPNTTPECPRCRRHRTLYNLPWPTRLIQMDSLDSVD